jgi:glycosyltransferase involved in cell wall biosynthesis
MTGKRVIDPKTQPPLDILHVFRAPVGGLFRHVVDLADGQIARGHRVGLIADATTGGAQAEALLDALAPRLALGLTRIAMSRQIGLSDISAVAHVTRRAAAVGVHVIHGHGAKGGAYARLASGGSALRVYTPHGGSLHYSWRSPVGLVYLAAERMLMRRTDLFLFESAYGCGTFRNKIGEPQAPARVVHNGVTEAEFSPIRPDPAATDLIFVGELRALKGVDVLLQAIAGLVGAGRDVTATIVGDGPDRQAFEAQARALALTDHVRFAGIKPAREAFALGRIAVVPSRAESLPYIVLEAAAAGLPIIATRVGGVAEIFGADANDLVPAGDPAALAQAIGGALENPARSQAAAQRLNARVRGAFSACVMTSAVLAAYREAMAERLRRHSGQPLGWLPNLR